MLNINYLYLWVMAMLIICTTNVVAQQVTVGERSNKKDRKFIHSIGITNAVHYDFLKEANNKNNLKRQDHNVNWAFRLFYELNYKNTLALEVGLNYLANSKGNYKGHLDSIQREINFEITRVFPQIFFNAKFYPSKIIKGYFVGLGYTRIKANYFSAATNPIFNQIDYDNSYAVSNCIILMVGKEYRYKKIRGDIRLGYYKHTHYSLSENDNAPSIIFTDNNFNETKSHYWYDALEFGLTFIL